MKRLFSLCLMFCLFCSVYAWKPIFAGHRGSYRGVQNTAEAYRNGADYYGYAGLECDVRVTSDGAYVICHDETTNSLGGNLTVANATLAQLKAETLSQTRGGVSYTGKLCTVEEYLDICKEKNVFPLIELKWTTGINNNDMSKFAGLAALVEAKGLSGKVIFLTSMKTSIEYIRTNYPSLKCQFLTNASWANHFDWCKQYSVDASIQSGCFDIHTVKKFHDAGLNVAVWTVNDEANYLKYAQMGVVMMTCDYLRPAEMSEMTPVDFTQVPDVVEPLKITTKILWRKCAADNTMLDNFPIGGKLFLQAQQAAYWDGLFYVNDYAGGKFLTYSSEGMLANNYEGSSAHGIAIDDAGNLVQRMDGVTKTPSKLRLYKKGTTTPIDLTFTLTKVGQANFIFASGDLFSPEGGYVYMYPEAQKYVNALHFVNGELKDIVVSNELSIAGSTAGVVIPIGNDPNNFIYQVRNVGFYRYAQGKNEGDYLTGSASTTAPDRNSSLGGAFFELAGHELLIHPSGTNYNGGLSIKDMSANKTNLATFTPLGSAGYTGNPSTGCFVRTESVDEKTFNIYEYCLGNGIAAYQVALQDVETTISASSECSLNLYPNPATDQIQIELSEPIQDIAVFQISGALMLHQAGGGLNTQNVDVRALPAGIYLVRINNRINGQLIKE